MTDLDAQLDLDPQQPEVQGPPQPVRYTPSAYEITLATERARLADELDQVLAENNLGRAHEIENQMRQDAASASLRVAMSGGNPAIETRPEGMFVAPEIEAARRAMHHAQLNRQVGQFLQSSQDWQEVQAWYADVERRYRERNEELLQPVNRRMSPAEAQKVSESLTPIQVDPNEVADMRFRAMKLDKQVQAMTGGVISLYRDPRTRRTLTYLNREAGYGSPGILTSGEQPLPAFTAYFAEPAAALVSGVGDPVTDLVWGLRDLTARGINALAGRDVVYMGPTNWIETPDGRVIPNHERIHPSFLGQIYGMWTAAAGGDIDKAVARFNASQEYSSASQQGFSWLLSGTAHVGGTIMGFAPTARAGQAAAETLKGGLRYVATGGLSAGAATDRARKIGGLLMDAAGQTAAFGVQEMLATGNPEQFQSALAQGAGAGLVLSVIGGMGKSTEWLLRNRKNMPARARTALAGAAEAVGFTASEIAEMQGGIWEFLKDPTAASWGDYTSLFAKNWLGILAARGMGARLGRPPTESLGFMRRISRAAVGEKVLEVKAGWQKAQEAVKGAVGKAKEKLTRKADVSRETEPWEAEISPELREQIREMGVEPRDLVRLAELQRRVEAGDEAAKQEFLDLERDLDIREIRYGNAEPEEIEAELAGIREARQRAAKKILEETGTPEEMTKLGSYQQQRRYQMAEGAPPPIGAKDIVRESDIYLRMEGFEGDAVRTPHFKGRLSAAANRRLSKSVRGFFARNPNFVRWMGSSVMATRSHEFSHAVGEAAYGLGSRVLGGDALKEAREMLEGYGGAGKLKPELVFDEAWAEYHARMLLQEPGLNRKYPALTQVFNRILSAKPKAMAQFMDVHRMMRQFHDYGVIGQFEMRTRSLEDVPMTETQKRARKTREGGVVKRATRKLEEWFFEDVERLRHSLGRWADIAGVDVSKIPITMNILRTLEALRGSEAGTAAEFLEKGVRFAVPGGRRSVGIKEILTAHIDTLEKKRAYQFYLEARRMLEMQKKGMVTGYPEEALLKIRDHYAKQLGGREMADALADATKSYWDSLIDWASSYGLLTPEEATNMIGSWQTYVPFQRYHSMALESGLGKGGGLRRLRGGTEEIADPIEAMQSVTLNIIRQVNRHRATQALWDMIHRYDGLAGLARVLKPGNVPQEYQIEALIRAIKASEEVPAEKKAGVDWTLQQLKELLGEDVAASAVLFRRQVDLPNNRSIIMHRQNGRMQWLEVDPDVFHALAAVENPMSGGRAIAAMRTFTKAARMPVELVRYFATTINPEFALRNMFRDAALFPGYSKVPRSLLPWSGLYYWGRGVSRWLRASTDKDLAELMSLYRAMGGAGMTYYARQIRRLRGSEELLPKGARAPEPYTPRGMIMRARRVLEGTVGKMVDIGEQALRFEEFVEVYRDRAKTMPQAQAALEALEASKEVTINFTRAGLISRQLNELIPYFNASMQGTRRWIRAFSGAEGKKVQRTAFANAASTLGAMTLLQYLFHKDEDWFKDLNSWQRLTNYNFMLGDQILTIPQPHFVGYAVSGVMDQLLSENKLTVRDLVDEGLQQLIFSHFALPSFLLPFMEWTTDYSFWRGRPLTPDWLEKSRLPSDQFNAYTAGWAKWAARTLNDYFPVVDWTPIKLENMVNQLTGSLPKNVERTIVGIGNSLGFELDEQRTELLDQVPVFSSLFRHTAHRGSYAVEQFYRRSDRLRQQKGSGQLDPREQQEYAVAEQLRSQLQAVRAMRDAGVLTQDEANRQQYEVVLPFMESFNR